MSETSWNHDVLKKKNSTSYKSTKDGVSIRQNWSCRAFGLGLIFLVAGNCTNSFRAVHRIWCFCSTLKSVRFFFFSRRTFRKGLISQSTKNIHGFLVVLALFDFLAAWHMHRHVDIDDEHCRLSMTFFHFRKKSETNQRKTTKNMGNSRNQQKW